MKAGGAYFELYVLGVLNADPSESATGTCGTPSPLGTANSDVVEDSSSTTAGCATPAGGMNALLASSDCGLRSSASGSITHYSRIAPPVRLSMRTDRQRGRVTPVGVTRPAGPRGSVTALSP